MRAAASDALAVATTLRVPVRLAEELAQVFGVGLLVTDPGGQRGRLLAAGPSRCLTAAGDDSWPSCIPLPDGPDATSRRCVQGRGTHLVHPVVVRGHTILRLVTGEIPETAAEGLSAIVGHLLRIVAQEMERVLVGLPESDEAHPTFPEVIGLSPAFVRLREELERAVRVNYPVLVQGESGTGKELISFLLHDRSPRRAGPYLAVNCAALPETLLESELFGHKRGAFTGADRDRPGLFALARGGTLLLDEVQQMSPASQAKLLRAVELGEYLPLGAGKPERSDARVVAATNADLPAWVEDGRFRRDLFYRLSVLRIDLPALRSVPSDVPALVRHFVQRIAAQQGFPVPQVAPSAMAALVSSPWPGNVRQLQHELQRALLRSNGAEIRVEHLSDELRHLAPPQGAFQAMRDHVLLAWEREQLRLELGVDGWNVSQTARRLGLSRRGLIDKLIRYGLRRPGVAAGN